jgi:Leucine Rich repeat
MATADWRAEIERALRDDSTMLNLTNKALGDEGTVFLAESLRGGSNVANVKLNNNRIGDAGAAAVAALLADPESATSLRGIMMCRNDVGSQGIAALADGLRHNATLKKLNVSDNPGVTGETTGVSALARAIGVNTTLESVHVGFGNPNQKLLDAALAGTEERRRGRQRFIELESRWLYNPVGKGKGSMSKNG